jgi:hypothetical protein
MDFQSFVEKGTKKSVCSPFLNSSGCPLVNNAKLYVWYDIPGHPGLRGTKERDDVIGPIPGVNPPGAPPAAPGSIPLPPIAD